MSRNAKSLGVAMVASVFYPSIGGAQTHTLRASQKLQERGVDVLVITRHYKGLARYEVVGGIPTYRVGNGDSYKAVAAISYIVGALRVLYAQRRRYHVLHCHQMISPMTIGLLARLLVRKPLIINPHRSGDIGDVAVLTKRRPFTGRLRLWAARRLTNAFVCISRAIHDELLGIGVAEAKLWDITNGVDLEHFRPATDEQSLALRQSRQLGNGPVVVFAGRLAKEKGLNILLDAWVQVWQQVPDATLLLIGEGDQREKLEAQAQQLGVAAQVVFTGGCDDVAPYLQAADAFVLPSFAEGLPISLLEAMASGLPSVATHVGGTSQLLEDGHTGRLVPVADSNALATALVEVLTSPVAHVWGQHARQHIAQHYSLDAVAEQYINMYQSLLHTEHEPAYAVQPGEHL